MKIGWKYSVLTLILLIPFVYAMGFTFPLGDDFARSNEARHIFDFYGGLHEMGRAWWKWSGRYTHHFLVLFLGDLVVTRETYALACAGLGLLYFTSLYGIFSTLQGKGKGRESVFLALFCVFGIYSGHQSLFPTYYVLTDILSLGIANALVLTFIWALCRLWYAPQVSKKAMFFAISSGILAVGCYEHSALATLLAAGLALVLAHLSGHPSKQAFLRVFVWIGIFFLLSFFCRGNFRRQTKRNVSLDVISGQLENAWEDWLTYGFRLFSSALLIPALAVGVLASPRRRLPPVARISGLGVTALVVLGYIMLSAAIVLVHAMSDVTVGGTSKLPASLALLGAYLTAFLALYQGDGLRRAFSRLPALLVISPLLAALCLTSNMRRTVEGVMQGKAAAYAAALEQRYAWLASPQASAANPAVVSENEVIFFPAGHEAFMLDAGDWPNKHIAEMYGVPAVRLGPLSAGTAYAEALTRGDLINIPVPPSLKNLGVERLGLGQGLGAVPNETFRRDWLVVTAAKPLSALTVLSVPQEGDSRLLPVFAQRMLRERALSRAELTFTGQERILDVISGIRHDFTMERWKVSAESGYVYALPVWHPTAGALAGLFAGETTGPLYRLSFTAPEAGEAKGD